MTFLDELKRRRVGKVAIAYGAIAWAVTEACSVVLPALRVPEWTMTFIVVVMLVGFPVAMVLAWVFDVGPDGIRRTEQLGGTPQATRAKLRIVFALGVIVCMAALGYLLFERGVGPVMAAQPRGSIAVLPFSNLSGDPARDYFSDGMSEELLNLLARVPGLQVASRTSSFAYRGRSVDIREVGRELGVEAVLEGSVRQAGDTVRITAQLIDAGTGFHLWSETYDRKLEDIFKVQDEISTAIVEQLRLELAPEQQGVARHDRAPTQNVQAYELYLKGRATWKKRGADNLKQAIELYQQALAHDPGFARAYAALASAYVVLPGYTPEDDAEHFLDLAERSARQALVLDANVGEAHAVIAQINANRGQLLDAESGFFFAMSLEPLEATPHHWFSILLCDVGRIEAALAQARRAQELDPGAPILASNLANVYLLKGDNANARRYTQLATDLGFAGDVEGVDATIALREQRWDDAREFIQRQSQLRAELKPLIADFVRAIAEPGARPQAVATMRAVPPTLVSQLELVQAYMQLGQLDIVYELLSTELTRDPAHWFDEVDFAHAWSPEGAAFRRDPRFSALAERAGYVQYWKQYGYPDGCSADRDRPVVCS